MTGDRCPERPTDPAARQVSPRLLLMLLTCAALSVWCLQHYVFALYIIEGSSMWPTFHDGDTAVVNMLARRIGPIGRGEIVLVRDGQFAEYATKRVVGLPDELIEFRGGRVYVNSRVLPEPYLHKGMQTVSERTRFRLGPREYFVLGDNRGDSFDSRTYGPISRDDIMGSYSRTFWACR